MNNIRETILKEISTSCLSNNAIKSNLLFISLLGSTRTHEEVESYSDLDILFILNSNESGAIDQVVLRAFKKMAQDLSKKYSLEISFLTHTIFDFEEYVDFNYLIHYSWGEVLYGDSTEYKVLFQEIIGSKYSDERRRDLIYYNLIHARFNLIRKYVSWNKFNTVDYKKNILKLIIDLIIEICDWSLVYKNIFKETKKEILKEFNSNFKLKNGHIPQQAYEIRSKWKDLSFEEDTLDKFIEESILFTQELIEMIYEEHTEN
ncbi:MAG: hypothetical protein KAS07_00385 [Candidatus Pacebacteria bacterium]|nr:hypothetical protein [Candidatus Paceibacterota bacterium]